MKSINNIGKNLTRGTLAVAVAGLALLTYSALAQEKGAERLTKLQRLNTIADIQKLEAGDTVVTSCPKCKDTWVTVVEQTGKAAHPQEKKTMLRHECPGCSTKIVTEGVGKQAKDHVLHTCTHCGSAEATCCAMKKDAGSAKSAGGQKNHKH